MQHSAITCVKHYVLNSLENACFKVDICVDLETLCTTHLLYFWSVVEDGAAEGQVH